MMQILLTVQIKKWLHKEMKITKMKTESPPKIVTVKINQNLVSF